MTKTAFWWHQTDGVRHRLIDFYRNSGEGLQSSRKRYERH